MKERGLLLAVGFLTLLLASLDLSLAQAAGAGGSSEAETALRAWFQRGGGRLDLKGESLRSAGELPALYARFNYQPLWTDASGPRPHARALLEAIRNAGRDGLSPKDYHLVALEERLGKAQAGGSLVALDLLMSDAWLTLANHLANGRIRPQQADPEWHIPYKPVPVLELIPAGREPKDLVGLLPSIAPPHPEYRRLKVALARIEGYVRAGGWPRWPDGPKLKEGDRDPRLPVLRQRLQVTGELGQVQVADPELLEGETLEALRRFQANQGLEVDGVLGKGTAAALNRTAQERAQQIQVNMERWRWLPRQWEKRFILVNMAGFELSLNEEGKEPLAMKTIVGQKFRSTPAFTRNLTHLVVNPAWHVPAKIAREDILPELRKDAAYAQKKKLKLFTRVDGEVVQVDPAEVDWTTTEGGFPYQIRQDPGPGNALGRIAFMLPNPFAIYLHDTPKRYLFDRAVRTFSSGCIRVEKPTELALRLLNGDGAWNGEKLQAAIDSNQTRTLTLPHPVPVYIVYLTTWADDAGHPQFRGDIYDRDARLAGLLLARDQG